MEVVEHGLKAGLVNFDVGGPIYLFGGGLREANSTDFRMGEDDCGNLQEQTLLKAREQIDQRGMKRT